MFISTFFLVFGSMLVGVMIMVWLLYFMLPFGASINKKVAKLYDSILEKLKSVSPIPSSEHSLETISAVATIGVVLIICGVVLKVLHFLVD